MVPHSWGFSGKEANLINILVYAALCVLPSHKPSCPSHPDLTTAPSHHHCPVHAAFRKSSSVRTCCLHVTELTLLHFFSNINWSTFVMCSKCPGTSLSACHLTSSTSPCLPAVCLSVDTCQRTHFCSAILVRMILSDSQHQSPLSQATLNF